MGHAGGFEGTNDRSDVLVLTRGFLGDRPKPPVSDVATSSQVSRADWGDDLEPVEKLACCVEDVACLAAWDSAPGAVACRPDRDGRSVSDKNPGRRAHRAGHEDGFPAKRFERTALHVVVLGAGGVGVAPLRCTQPPSVFQTRLCGASHRSRPETDTPTDRRSASIAMSNRTQRFVAANVAAADTALTHRTAAAERSLSGSGPFGRVVPDVQFRVTAMSPNAPQVCPRLTDPVWTMTQTVPGVSPICHAACGSTTSSRYRRQSAPSVRTPT